MADENRQQGAPAWPTSEELREHFRQSSSLYIVRDFPRVRRGYDADLVDDHLKAVRGWFSIAEIDRVTEDYAEQVEARIREAREAAEAEARAAQELARQEAEAARE